MSSHKYLASLSSPKKLKQKTLAGFLSSPPSRASSASTTKRTKTNAQKRGRVISPESDHDAENNDTRSDVSDVGAVRFEPEVIDLSDEGESPRRPRTQKRTPRLRAESASSDEEKSIASSGESVTQRKRRKTRNSRQVEGDSESEEMVQQKKRKLVKGIRPLSPGENDDNILDEVDEYRIIEPRLRTRDKRTTFQKNLERLKRKKRGLAPSESSQSTQSANEDGAEDEDTHPVTPFAGARPDTRDEGSSPHDESFQEPEDDSFIVEDDDAPSAELPMEYSMNTHQDLAHHFKIICQLFVHLAVRPVAERQSFMKDVIKSEEYFSVPLKIARRKFYDLRDALASSVWRPDFKKQLQKYPTFELTRLDFAVPACDACHLGGRMSTLLGRVSGLPYERYSFEPLVAADSSDSDYGEEDDEGPTKEFNLGRFCARRTQVFHRFTHWEYSLFQILSREVEELQFSNSAHGFVRVAFAKGIKPPKDLTDADRIMDWLDQRGVIDMEWQTVRQLMESARNLEIDAKGGEDDVA